MLGEYAVAWVTLRLKLNKHRECIYVTYSDLDKLKLNNGGTETSISDTASSASKNDDFFKRS